MGRLRDHSVFMAGGGLVRIKVGVTQNSRQFEGGGGSDIRASVLYQIYKLSPSARVCISDTTRPLML